MKRFNENHTVETFDLIIVGGGISGFQKYLYQQQAVARELTPKE